MTRPLRCGQSGAGAGRGLFNNCVLCILSGRRPKAPASPKLVITYNNIRPLAGIGFAPAAAPPPNILRGVHFFFPLGCAHNPANEKTNGGGKEKKQYKSNARDGNGTQIGRVREQTIRKMIIQSQKTWKSELEITARQRGPVNGCEVQTAVVGMRINRQACVNYISRDILFIRPPDH